MAASPTGLGTKGSWSSGAPCRLPMAPARRSRRRSGNPPAASSRRRTSAARARLRILLRCILRWLRQRGCVSNRIFYRTAPQDALLSLIGPPGRAVLPGGKTPPHAGCCREAAVHCTSLPLSGRRNRCEELQPPARELRLMPVSWLSNLGVRGRAPRRQPALQPTNSAEDPFFCGQRKALRTSHSMASLRKILRKSLEPRG